MKWPVAPMKAVAATIVPTGDEWAYEPKWDGHRVIIRRQDGRFDAVSSTGKPKLMQWPWLQAAVAAATERDVILDGEVVAYDDQGRHSFQLVGSDRPHSYVAFDVLTLDGVDLLAAPWGERRALLEAHVRNVAPLSLTPVSDDAELIEAATRAQHFEGLIAKRTTSTYQPGRRSSSWVKVKYLDGQEMVVGGYKLGEGNRRGLFGSLLVGVYERRGGGGALQFVGAVGTGFTDAMLRSIMPELRARETDECPFAEPPKFPRGTVRWVRPELVAQVGFLEWTMGGGIRAPVFLGLRDDKDPRDVVRET